VEHLFFEHLYVEINVADSPQFDYTPSPAEAEFDVLTAGFRTIHLCP
jgi:hypothetical protein